MNIYYNVSYESDPSFIFYIMLRKRSLAKVLNQANKKAFKKNKSIMNDKRAIRDL
jgi:hypothetical protein